ncbi:MAG TPA: hypothetical protein VMD28_09090, partial [Acidimicrobiales bacterium]|nr:hypothetical protein [Acidimicrobiales bacterium]
MQVPDVPERFRPLVEATATLAERFRRAGHRVYLVGGSVRDALVERPAAAQSEGGPDGAGREACTGRRNGAGGAGATGTRGADAAGAADARDLAAPVGPAGGAAPPGDYDLTTEATPDEIERIVRGWADAVWTQGKRFGTIGLRAGGRTYEVTTHRAEAYRPDSRKPDVTFGHDVETDLSRRDFTVNAMALELPELRLVDPFGGLGDLAAHRLRTPLDPEVSFADDPLRMLRAARFAAAYGLVPDPALVQAVREGHHRLSIVSAER